MRHLLLSLLATAGVLFFSQYAAAQTAAAPARITAPIDDSVLTTLRGNLSALARPEFDRGRASPAAQLNFMRLALKRTPEQQAALEALLAGQVDKRSPNYHQWLTPEEFGRRFGPADADIAAIAGWLAAHGFKVQTITPGHTNIPFSGTVAQVEAAFHTSIHSFGKYGEQYLSNVTEPSIPAALAPVVSGIAQLSTYGPRAFNIRGRSGRYDFAQKRLTPIDGTGTATGTGPTPYFTEGGNFLWLVPGDAATIYDTPNSFNANFSSGTSYTGSGVTIGIGGDGMIRASTVVDFRTRFLGSSTAPTIIDAGALQGGVPAAANGDTDEAYLDTELSGGMAPGATIVFYVANRDASGGVFTAIDQMIADGRVDIFSLSFGACELELTTSDNQQLSTWWAAAAAQGIAVTVSTGDSGSAECDDPGSEEAASGGLMVSGFASTPYNIAVGGTDFYGLYGNFAQYVGTSQGSSQTFYRTAFEYIPESTWNDSTGTNGPLADNSPEILNNGRTDIVSGGGGASNCSTNKDTATQQGQFVLGTCTSGYAKPSWQGGAGVPNDGARDIPDVSLMAGNGLYGAAWLVCTDDTTENASMQIVTENCTNQPDGNFYYSGFGGTSTSAPSFAGILALVQQANGGSGASHRLGAEGAKKLYDLFNSPRATASAVFHDITVGNNSVYCISGTPNCSLNTAGFDFLTGYDATAGYDLATGLGSVDATNLIQFWSGTSSLPTPAVTVTPANNGTFISSESEAVTVTVAGAGAGPTPTGNVTLSAANYTSAAMALNSGSANFTIPANAITTAGNVTLTANYTGDAVYGGNFWVGSITVNQPYSVATTTPAEVNPGANATATITLTADASYSGTVSLTCALATSPFGAQDPPQCLVTAGSPVVFTNGTASPTSSTVTITSTAATSSNLERRGLPGWAGAGGGLALALVIFIGVPARRRSWRNLLGVLVVMAALGALSACGGGGGSGGGGGGGGSNPGTTAGNYTFTVIGTGNPGVTPAPTANLTLTIN